MRSSAFYTTLVCAFCISSPLFGQRIDNVKARVMGEKVIITYDINGAQAGQKFKLQLFGSHNNFTTSLSFVKGDIGGRELLPGTGKRIEWDAGAELDDFTGEITFEIRGEVIAAPLALLNPSLGAKAKRGKSMNIRWAGIPVGQKVKLELVKGGVINTPIIETTSTGSYTWIIPKAVFKGSDYQVKLTTQGKSVVSNPFTIKNKTSLLVWALPVVVAGGAAYIFLKPSEGSKTGSPTGLPLPPDPE